MNARTGSISWVLLGGDVLALLLFVLAGQGEHELLNAANPLPGFLLTAGEFIVAWLAAAAWCGALRTDAPPVPRAFMHRSLNAWLLAAPLGALLRALLLGRAEIPTAFLIVVLLLGGMLLLGWRLVYAILSVRRSDARSVASGRG